MKNININKNRNAGAIITTPKYNSVCKNTTYDLLIVVISSPIFCPDHPYAQPPK